MWHNQVTAQKMKPQKQNRNSNKCTITRGNQDHKDAPKERTTWDQRENEEKRLTEEKNMNRNRNLEQENHEQESKKNNENE